MKKRIRKRHDLQIVVNDFIEKKIEFIQSTSICFQSRIFFDTFRFQTRFLHRHQRF